MAWMRQSRVKFLRLREIATAVCPAVRVVSLCVSEPHRAALAAALALCRSLPPSHSLPLRPAPPAGSITSPREPAPGRPSPPPQPNARPGPAQRTAPAGGSAVAAAACARGCGQHAAVGGALACGGMVATVEHALRGQARRLQHQGHRQVLVLLWRHPSRHRLAACGFTRAVCAGSSRRREAGGGVVA